MDHRRDPAGAGRASASLGRGPGEHQLKYDWLKNGGYKGFGIWVAGAVGAVEQYWWGGGCNGNTSQKVCPQNMTLTKQFASEMWAPVPGRAAWD